MKKITKIIIITMSIGLIITTAGYISYAAGLENYTLQGEGRFEYDGDGSGTAGDSIDDVVYDASDLATIENQVKTGKESLSTALNQYPNTEVATLDTFANLSTAIDTITSVPDVYYYDKATEGDTCQRYMLIDGAYYPCDKYGVKTSDTALSGTITVVTKDDTTTPAAGEVQLVKYTSTEDANLSAGFAGYADKTFILGSGSDNVTYRNLGYAQGYADGQNNSGEIVYTYHVHGDGYCNEIPIYHAHNGNTSSGGSCYSPRYCGGRKLEADGDTGYAQCTSCGGWTYGSKGTCPIIKGYTLSCGKTTETVESYICGRNEGDILSATIKFTE